MRADLHCHSTASDGTLSPKELIYLAKKEGLFALSITDHDTIEAYETALPVAQEQGVLLGTGVEFSCDMAGFSIHVLGYDYNLSDEGIQKFCLRHKQRREDRNHAILEKLAKRGFNIDEQELLKMASYRSVGRPHIAEQMVVKGYVASIQEAFDKYLGDGKSCFAQGTPFSILETINIIHAAAGKAFIAHPHLLSKKVSLNSLLAFPFDGIECFYGRLSEKEVKPWCEMARTKNWLISGGSDFHGSNKPSTRLGSSYVGKKEFDEIFTSLLAN